MSSSHVDVLVVNEVHPNIGPREGGVEANEVASQGEKVLAERRMDVKKVLAIDVIVGKMAKMHFIEGHLSGMGDTIVSGKEGEEDYGEQHWQAPFGPLWRLGLRKWFVLVEHVVSQRWFVLEFL